MIMIIVRKVSGSDKKRPDRKNERSDLFDFLATTQSVNIFNNSGEEEKQREWNGKVIIFQDYFLLLPGNNALHSHFQKNCGGSTLLCNKALESGSKSEE